MNSSKTSNKTKSRRSRPALILAFLLAICLPATAFASPAPSATRVKTTISQVSAYEVACLKAQKTGATYGNEWALMALARAGKLPSTLKQQYLANLSTYLKDNKNSLGSTVTDYDRVILALTALGVDATSFNGVNLTAPLANLDDVTAPGVSGSINALLALDSHPYAMPKLKAGAAGVQTTRAKLVSDLLSQQLPGTGGWNWGWGATDPDPDVTSMALQALAPYQGKGDAQVDGAIDTALTALGQIQDGATAGFIPFPLWTPDPNSESAAQALTALSALGIPVDDARFVKTGSTIYDSLTSFLVEGGSGSKAFANAKSDATYPAPDAMATEQGLYALAAYWRALTGANRLYDMSDVALKPYTNAPANKGGTSGGKTGGASKQKKLGAGKTGSGTAAPSTPLSTASTATAATLANTGDTTGQSQLGATALLLLGATAALCVLRKRSGQRRLS
ncbi:MAG: hypothetical protein FWD65_02100 [Coriobacteriia bacterium]|nr:hypothetical protein [Coriobacteriia bacterium]